MSTSVQRTGQSLVNDLMSWMDSMTSPEVRIEEYVEGDRRIIRADLPGINPAKDIELTVDGSVLHLRGERRSEEHDEHHTEIHYGSFERVIALPPGTKPEDVTADYTAGVLVVSMPTAAPAASTKIPVTHRELPAE